MEVDLIITLHENCVSNTPAIADKLRQQGLTVSGVTDYGVIMGKAEKSLIPTLSGQKEVESVLEDFYTQLPPPESDIQ